MTFDTSVAPRAIEKSWWECPAGHQWETTQDSIKQGRGCLVCAGRIRRTIEDVRTAALEKGYTFLSPTFEGTQKRYTWGCTQGHTWTAAYNNIMLRGDRCRICAGKARVTLEVARARAQERGFQFLSKTFTTTNDQYRWRCSQGHEWTTTYNAVIWRGSGCSRCSGRGRQTIDDVLVLAKERGFQFLSKEFTLANNKYLWKCAEGHQWTAQYTSIKIGTGCPQCGKKRTGDAQRLSEDEVRKRAQAAGVEYVSGYTKSNINCTWRCSVHGLVESQPANLFSGQGICRKCGHEKAASARRTTVDEIRARTKTRGIELLSNSYTNRDEKLLWKCSVGHTWKASWQSVGKGNGCPICGHITTSQKRRGNFVSAETVRNYIQMHGILSAEYRRLSLEGGLPPRFPSNPPSAYEQPWSFFTGKKPRRSRKEAA